MVNISFRYWLEAVQEYRQQIQGAVIKKVRELLDLQGSDEDVLNQNLKNLSRHALMDIVREGNRKNFDEGRLKSIVREIRRGADATYTVSQLIDRLDEDIDRTVQSKSKTYPPKTPAPAQNLAPPPTPQAPVPPPAGPMPIQPSAPIVMPPQSI